MIVEPKNCQIEKEYPKIYMRNEEMKQVESATHLGIIRALSLQKTCEINVEENIKKARRTAYSLLPSGLHGNSGLDTETKIDLVKIYIIPIYYMG